MFQDLSPQTQAQKPQAIKVEETVTTLNPKPYLSSKARSPAERAQNHSQTRLQTLWSLCKILNLLVEPL